ncbi:hypothetical protein IPF86_00205 [Candidatus Nomurabacteria bacterium]|jgi:hypothetical protein|nr:MAG: hypothetical protein IPF86_00205 [Candidatus Nomurabacteria bacterium]
MKLHFLLSIFATLTSLNGVSQTLSTGYLAAGDCQTALTIGSKSDPRHALLFESNPKKSQEVPIIKSKKCHVVEGVLYDNDQPASTSEYLAGSISYVYSWPGEDSVKYSGIYMTLALQDTLYVFRNFFGCNGIDENHSNECYKWRLEVKIPNELSKYSYVATLIPMSKPTRDLNGNFYLVLYYGCLPDGKPVNYFYNLPFDRDGDIDSEKINLLPINN